MPNGKHGDNPLSDLAVHAQHPYQRARWPPFAHGDAGRQLGQEQIRK